MLRSTVVCLLGMSVGLSLSPALAQEGKEVKGVLQEIDATVGTVALLLGDGPKTMRVKTFNLARPDLPVTDAAGQALKLTDLKPDQRVYLKIAADDVVAIRLAPPSLYGTLVRVDVEQRLVTLKMSMGERAVSIPAEAKIVNGQQPVQLNDLKTGFPVLIALSPDRKTVLEVRTGKGVMPIIRLQKVIGILIDVDRDKKTVDILVSAQDGDHNLLRHLTFTPDPSFELLYQSRPFREMTLDEVARGNKVTVWTEVDTKKVAQLDLEMPTLARRAVKTFDAGQGRLVLEDSEGEKIFQLSPQVRVQTATGAGRLADIRPGVGVSCGLGPDRRRVEVVRVWEK